jgi:hypothetical protein
VVETSGFDDIVARFVTFWQEQRSWAAVVVGECAHPQLPPPCATSSQSSSSRPPCRSGHCFGALAVHSWPPRSPSAATHRWCYLPSEEPPQGTTSRPRCSPTSADVESSTPAQVPTPIHRYAHILPLFLLPYYWST